MRSSSSWRRGLGKVRSFVGNSLGGVTGGSNLASCSVAVTLAHFLWVKPSQDLNWEQQRQIEKRKPIPDPQDTGLIYARKRETKESDA